MSSSLCIFDAEVDVEDADCEVLRPLPGSEVDEEEHHDEQVVELLNDVAVGVDLVLGVERGQQAVEEELVEEVEARDNVESVHDLEFEFDGLEQLRDIVRSEYAVLLPEEQSGFLRVPDDDDEQHDVEDVEHDGDEEAHAVEVGGDVVGGVGEVDGAHEERDVAEVVAREPVARDVPALAREQQQRHEGRLVDRGHRRQRHQDVARVQLVRPRTLAHEHAEQEHLQELQQGQHQQRLLQRAAVRVVKGEHRQYPDKCQQEVNL